MTDLRQAAQQLIDRIYREGASPLDWPEYYALEDALEQQAEPICPSCKAKVLYECVACSSNNYPTQQQAEPGTREGFNDWWDGDYDDSANPFEQDSAAYWAWAGWKSAKRPWVGLTDEDFLEACQIAERGNYLVAFQRIQIKLKERNT